ncbi:LOW QUALITY PROTEIN: uncharacterized protein ACNLHF_019286 [Anomaloglossus baeobatrachus]
MDRDRDKIAERILHLTLEILFRLTGEDYTVVKKTSSDRCQEPVSELWRRPLRPITVHLAHPLIHEDINDQKILELTYKMIELLTGEVPIRCQDVTVYFSMEEWEYLEGHKDLYKDIMMVVPQPLISPVLSSERTTPERCPRPLLPQDCKQQNAIVLQDIQGEDLTHINTTGTYGRGDERCKEEIPTDNLTDDCTSSSEKHPIFSDFKANYHGITTDTYKEHAVISNKALSLHSKSQSSHSSQVLSSPWTVTQNENNKKNGEHQKAHKRKESYECLECGKCFIKKSNLFTHQGIHTGEEPFSCSECGKCFNQKSSLDKHKRSHTGEKPYSCSECGKCFKEKTGLVKHKIIHTGEKPFLCSECGKCFNLKTNLVRHQIIHTGEVPFRCSECGKCFNQKSSLDKHKRIHTGEKPYLCSECGKCFMDKSNFYRHQKVHTVKKQFSCSECGKCFNLNPNLVRHLRIHTGEELFLCSECGKCFTQKSSLDKYKRIHTGEKPYSCSCGKCFMNKSNLCRHQKTVVKKTSSERCQDPVSEGWGRPLSPITGPPPHLLIHEDINDQKILELTYKMIELLTGEVPIRCQDVTIYFSMEEWKYLEGHKDLYKDVMMGVPQPLTSPVLSSERTTPERCPRPFLPQDCKQEDPDVPQDHKGEDLTYINATGKYVSGDEWCKEEIPTDNHTDNCTRSSEKHLIFLDFTANDHGITTDTYQENAIISDIAKALHSKGLSSDSFRQVISSSQTVMQNKKDGEHKRAYKRKKSYECSVCGKCFPKKSNLVTHKTIHTEEKPFSCSFCGKCFKIKSNLFTHQRIHTGEKPFLCTECGKCFRLKTNLVRHQRIHTGEEPFSCSECGKSFKQISGLVTHKIIHTGEKPYSCSVCGKCFNQKANLAKHQRIHTGEEEPYSCSECGKCFTLKAHLVRHQRIHTGEEPYSCSECGKSFNQKSSLVTHKRIHTGEKPYSCSECGKCFMDKSNFRRHEKGHTVKKQF